MVLLIFISLMFNYIEHFSFICRSFMFLLTSVFLGHLLIFNWMTWFCYFFKKIYIQSVRWKWEKFILCGVSSFSWLFLWHYKRLFTWFCQYLLVYPVHWRSHPKSNFLCLYHEVLSLNFFLVVSGLQI